MYTIKTCLGLSYPKKKMIKYLLEELKTNSLLLLKILMNLDFFQQVVLSNFK
jgi:hypothetical protein